MVLSVSFLLFIHHCCSEIVLPVYLGRNEYLENIAIEIEPESLPILVQTLGSVVSKRLTSLKILYNYSITNERPDHTHWNSLDNVLAQSASFRAIPEILFLIHNSGVPMLKINYPDLLPNTSSLKNFTLYHLPLFQRPNSGVWHNFCGFW